MELRHLRYILRVAETASFTAAARSLNVSQPTLSQQVRDVEAELGVPIFVREQRGVSVTQPGRIVIAHAERILAAASGLKASIAEYRGLKRGSLTIGVTQSFNTLHLPDIIARFAADHPAIDLAVHELANAEIIAAVEAGRFDLGIGIAVAGMEVDASPLYAETLMFACSQHHRLAGEETVPLAALTAETVALLPAGFTTRAAIDALLRDAGVRPDRIVEFNTLAAIIAAIGRSSMVSLLPAATEKLSPVADLVFRPFDPNPPLRVVSLLKPAPGYETPAAQAFETAVRTQFPST